MNTNQIKAINAAIAECCGWKHRLATHQNPVERHGMRLPNYFGDDVEAFWRDDIDGVFGSPPNYFGSLDACREFEEKLFPAK